MSVPTTAATIDMKEYKYIKKDVFSLICDDDKTLVKSWYLKGMKKWELKTFVLYFLK